MEVSFFFFLFFSPYFRVGEKRMCVATTFKTHFLKRGRGTIRLPLNYNVCVHRCCVKKGSRGQKEEMTKAPLGGTHRLECKFSVFENVYNLTVCGSWGRMKFKPIRNLRFLVTIFPVFPSLPIYSQFFSHSTKLFGVLRLVIFVYQWSVKIRKSLRNFRDFYAHIAIFSWANNRLIWSTRSMCSVLCHLGGFLKI